MLRIRTPGLREERGGVMVTFAIVLPLLLVFTAGGFASFVLYTGNRELQRAADQSALAGAAAMPLFDPNVLTEQAPYPVPGAGDVLPADVPRIGDVIPDPRLVSCTVGGAALAPDSGGLVNAFGDAATEVVDPDDPPPAPVCTNDPRVEPVMQPVPATQTPVQCTNALVDEVSDRFGPIDPDDYLDLLGELPSLLPPLSDPIPQIQSDVNRLVDMPLERVLPAALAPRMRVDVWSPVRLPMPLVRARTATVDSGVTEGILRTGATAQRRIKNAVVVPILPGAQAAIEAELINPVTGRTYVAADFVLDPLNLNRALRAAQAPLIDAIDDADNRLNTVMSALGLGCHHLLANIRQDLRDIYDPPSGTPPTALQIVDTSIDAARTVAARTGAALPDPDDPMSDPYALAGEAVLLIGMATDEAMRPVAATQIPILDPIVATVSKVPGADCPLTVTDVYDDCYKAAAMSAANAWGLFRASLVE